VIVGQDRAVDQFASAWASRKLHHAWLFAGPKGVGKASFARAAARRVLADAAGPPVDLSGIEAPEEHRIVKLVDARSHPDMRWLERLEKEKGDGLARDITIKQVRGLGEFMGMTAALSPWRVAVIDSMDEMNKEASNALLKMLEEPPANTLFFLVSHAPGRLLPTIRSRCRLLHFDALADDAMTSILGERSPNLSAAERKRVVEMSFGSAGRALAFADLGLAKLEDAAIAILRGGDPTNAQRAALAIELGKKASHAKRAACGGHRSSVRWTLMRRRASWRRSRPGSRSTPPRPCSRSAGFSQLSADPLP